MLVGLFLLTLAQSTLTRPPVVRDVLLAPGETVRVTIVGEGRPVVLVPGLLGSAFAFRRIIPPLDSAGLQVIVIEPLGIGHSSRPKRADYSLTAQAGRVAAVLDTLGVRGAVVLGHSVSTSTALRLALLRPDLVSAIIADNGGPEEEAATSGVKRAAKFAFLLRIFGGRALMRSELQKGLRSTAGNPEWITREVVDRYGEGAERDPGAVLDALQGMARARDEPLAPRLSTIGVPVHLLVGGAPRGSGLKPSLSMLLQDQLPDFAVDTARGAGLHIHEEQPAVVVRALLDMVARLDQAAP